MIDGVRIYWRCECGRVFHRQQSATGQVCGGDCAPSSPIQLPWASCPKPAEHWVLAVHLKEPSVFTQSKPSPQVWLCTKHSLTSAEDEKEKVEGIGSLQNATCFVFLIQLCAYS